ncbi:hypothetical protein BWQ96_04513 [Gracilariopsis chorda]|uniref:NAD(P)-binding domain-containing protein n=1 Tax=Gracilariopsis chorda TaxID=448386 RepID=A0A2V3IUG3_9FLOR|nr:hypothetical protein BWQ96_04513 [Gracilariopsis chorda]|eukprot:PXF45745.1 hypothetical protein BWQ96_04513 [Gracilariopsis chorda]
MTTSILVLGASGRTGQQFINAAYDHPDHPQVHAFARNPQSLPSDIAEKCTSVQKGDALLTDQVYDALVATEATHIVVSIGVPNSAAQSTLRYDSAVAIIEAMRRYKHTVKTIIVSALGAGGSKIQFGFGIGMFYYFILRHVMRDHDRQEDTFDKYYQENKKGLLILRPTLLVDGQDGAKVLLFDGQGHTPSKTVDRYDMAVWVVNQICGDGDRFGEAVHITKAV